MPKQTAEVTGGTSVLKLRCSPFHPPRLEPIQHGPQSLGGTLGGSQCFFGSLRIRSDLPFQLFTPDLRMVYVGGGVQSEIAARLLIGPIQFAQSTIFFLGDSRHLRFVGIKSRQRLFWSSFSRDTLEPLDQLADLSHRPPSRDPASAHAFDEVEP